MDGILNLQHVFVQKLNKKKLIIVYLMYIMVYNKITWINYLTDISSQKLFSFLEAQMWSECLKSVWKLPSK